jgi:peroxiredoxin
MKLRESVIQHPGSSPYGRCMTNSTTSTSPTSTTSLTAATEELRSGLQAQLGAVLDSFDASADELATRTWPAKAVGEAAPDFELPDARGGSVTLAGMRRKGPVVLVFYRGAWCPYCNLQLRAFQASLADIHAAGASLVAISPQTPDNSLTLAEQAELAFPVLSDAGNDVARSYGLVFTLSPADRELHSGVGMDLAAFNGDDSWELPTAAVFVIDTDGTIRYASVAGDFRWRVGPDEVLAALRA